jgi:hypothetical protein
MAQELLCDCCFPRCVFACRERGDSLLCAASFGIFRKNLAQAFVAGAKPAAPDQEFGELDASGRALWCAASANFLSPHRPRWTSDTYCSFGNKSV